MYELKIVLRFIGLEAKNFFGFTFVNFHFNLIVQCENAHCRASETLFIKIDSRWSISDLNIYAGFCPFLRADVGQIRLCQISRAAFLSILMTVSEHPPASFEVGFLLIVSRCEDEKIQT